MNFYHACEILEIENNQIHEICSSQKLLKRQYTKLALKYHPDKTRNDTTAHFQSIHEAYHYLKKLSLQGIKEEFYSHFSDDTTPPPPPPSYMALFQCFMGTLDDPVAAKYLDDVLIKVLNVCEMQAAQMIEKVEEPKFFVVYNILNKYKHVFHLSRDFYDRMEKKKIYWLEQNKMKNRRLADNFKNEFVSSDFETINHEEKNIEKNISNMSEKEIFETMKMSRYDDINDTKSDLVLQPTLNDLWENNVYKFTKSDKSLLIPLWHHELIYEIDEKEFVVQMKPKLPSQNYWIDDQNNLHQLHEYTITELWDSATKEKGINVFFGRKRFVFYPHKLLLKPHQKWVWPKEGLTCIQYESIYDISLKSDVILHIHIMGVI